MAATKKHNTDTPELKFWIFDFPEVAGDYNTRCTSMYGRYNDISIFTPSLPLIQVGVAHSHEELDVLHGQAVHAGYEGIIIRNTTGLYEYNKRSLNVFKYKIAQDAEFYVRSFALDKNGHAVFSCNASDADTESGEAPQFKVKLPVGIMFRKVDADGEAAE